MPKKSLELQYYKDHPTVSTKLILPKLEDCFNQPDAHLEVLKQAGIATSVASSILEFDAS